MATLIWPSREKVRVEAGRWGVAVCDLHDKCWVGFYVWMATARSGACEICLGFFVQEL
jgi:hypothetical protein